VVTGAWESDTIHSAGGTRRPPGPAGSGPAAIC